MSKHLLPLTDAWVITDGFGRISRASREGRTLLGLSNPHRTENLLHLFPQYHKVLAFDIQVALTGWPTGRTLVLKPFAPRPLAIQYRVSRHTESEGTELFWHLQAAESDPSPRCA